MTGRLQDVVWLATLVAGLTMAVAWRTRLNRRAAPAIAGFAVLLAAAAVNLLWAPALETPDSSDIAGPFAAIGPADLAILLATYVAYPAGFALLLLAVLRSRTADPAAD